MFSLGRWSSQIPAGFHVSCGTRVFLTRACSFAYRAVTVCGRPFQARSTRAGFGNSSKECGPSRGIPRPRSSNAHTLTLDRFRLFPVRSPLLGESQLVFFSSGYLDVSVPRVRCRRLCIHRRLAGSPCAGCPIRKSPDHCLLAASRSLSQLSTSFFASHRLGIHHAPFVA